MTLFHSVLHILWRYAWLGIVSFGVGCAEEGYPGAYTRTQCFLGFVAEQFGLKVAFPSLYSLVQMDVMNLFRLTLPRPERIPLGAQTAPTEPADELPGSVFTSEYTALGDDF